MKTVTIDNLNDCTAQEVFDFVAHHLMTQGVQSLNENNCQYRSEEGLKCAAGCLVPDDKDITVWEGWAWGDLIDKKLVPNNHEALIEDLQVAHDAYLPTDWRLQLIKVAKKFDLDESYAASLRLPL